MSERVQRQAEAERAVRRGELKQALAIYRELAREAPEDPLVPSRIATIESLLQPDEISVSGPAPVPPASLSLSRSATLEQTAEMHFERGDIKGAVATYERIREASALKTTISSRAVLPNISFDERREGFSTRI